MARDENIPAVRRNAPLLCWLPATLSLWPPPFRPHPCLALIIPSFHCWKTCFEQPSHRRSSLTGSSCCLHGGTHALKKVSSHSSPNNSLDAGAGPRRPCKPPATLGATTSFSLVSGSVVFVYLQNPVSLSLERSLQ